MKRVMGFVLMVILVIGLSSCSDNKKTNKIINILEEEGYVFDVFDADGIDFINDDFFANGYGDFHITYVATNVNDAESKYSLTVNIPVIWVYQFESEVDLDAFEDQFCITRDLQELYYKDAKTLVCASDFSVIELLINQ